MRVLLLRNSRSGRGAGAEVAAGLASALSSAGHAVTWIGAGPGMDEAEFRSALRASDVLVVAGGDGTLHHALPAIIETGIRFYHFPLGTENLFTREFGMDRRPATLVRAIAGGGERVCDAGECGGKPFALMVSIGFDACVVERVARERGGGITRAAYVRQAVRELMSLRTPTVSVRVDGRVVIDGRRGLLVVANSRQYAARLDPARDADMSDGLLDVVFMPHSTAVGLARWLFGTATGLHTRMSGLIVARGETIEVDTDGPCPHQIDGEAAGPVPSRAGGASGLDVRVLKGVLRVLTP